MNDTSGRGDRQADESTAIVSDLKGIPDDIDPVLLSRRLTGFAHRLAAIPEHEAEAIIRIYIAERFNLPKEELKAFRATVRQHQKSRPIANLAVCPEDIRDQLQRDKGTVVLNPAQDYHAGRMYVAANIGGDKYMITSDREAIPFEKFKSGPVKLRNVQLTAMHFSPDGIMEYLNGRPAPNLPDLFEELVAYFQRFVFIQDKRWYTVLALWAMLTYVYRIFQVFPYLWVNAEKGSGKSTLLRTLKGICFNAVHQVSLTPAVLFRDISTNSITLLFDEVEQLRQQDKDMRSDLMSLLNGGFDKGITVKRNEKGKHGNFELTEFCLFGPKVLAGIRGIDDVLEDRTIKIPLLRMKEGEQVESYRQSPTLDDEQRRIRDSLYIFSLTWGPSIADRYLQPHFDIRGMDHLQGREREMWQPLFQLANLIDAAMDDSQLTSALTYLSALSAQEKQRANASSNETSLLLTVLKRLMEERPFQRDNENHVSIQCAEAFEYFQKSDEYDWLKARNSLTFRLAKIKVETDRRRFGADRRTYYVIALDQFSDLCERYGVPLPPDWLGTFGQYHQAQSDSMP